MDLLVLCKALRESWGEDTAQPHDGVWSHINPAKGQCAVSTMVVKDYFGGDVVRGVTRNGVVHYWNQLEGGVWLDTTHSQFGDGDFIEEYIIRPPDYLWRFADTVRRYEILRERVVKFIE